MTRTLFSLFLMLTLSACGFRLAGSDSNDRFVAGTTVATQNSRVNERNSLALALRSAGATLARADEADITVDTRVETRSRALQVDSSSDATELEQVRVTEATYFISATKTSGSRRFVSTRQRLVGTNSTGSARLAEQLDDEMAAEQNQQIAAWLARAARQSRAQ